MAKKRENNYLSKSESDYYQKNMPTNTLDQTKRRRKKKKDETNPSPAISMMDLLLDTEPILLQPDDVSTR